MHDAGLRVDTYHVPMPVCSFNPVPAHGEGHCPCVLREWVLLVELDMSAVTTKGFAGCDERRPVVPLRLSPHAGDELGCCVREPLGRHHIQRSQGATEAHARLNARLGSGNNEAEHWNTRTNDSERNVPLDDESADRAPVALKYRANIFCREAMDNSFQLVVQVASASARACFSLLVTVRA